MRVNKRNWSREYYDSRFESHFITIILIHIWKLIQNQHEFTHPQILIEVTNYYDFHFHTTNYSFILIPAQS